MEFRACRACGEEVEPVFRIEQGDVPAFYLCPNDHKSLPGDAEREVRCPNCKKKLADHLYGNTVVTCPRCKTRSNFQH